MFDQSPAPAPLALICGLALSACNATPPKCAYPELREIRTIDRLIADTRADIARGYRTERTQSDTRINLCLGGQRSNVGVSFCTAPGGNSRTVALDTEAEARKLDALSARRTALQGTLAARQAACTKPG